VSEPLKAQDFIYIVRTKNISKLIVKEKSSYRGGLYTNCCLETTLSSDFAVLKEFLSFRISILLSKEQFNKFTYTVVSDCLRNGLSRWRQIDT
jgi:hypothetical protein